MKNQKSNQSTITNDQIRVSENVNSVTDILRMAKPYLDVSLEKMKDGDPQSYGSIEVPPALFRDLVMMVAADLKRAQGITVGRVAASGDSSDNDWNPFASGGMNFPDLDK